MISKEDYADLSPVSRDFWNSVPSKDRASIPRSARSKPKPMPVPLENKINSN